MTSLSEVETMDTLPFVKDTTPMSNDDIKVVAPSIEQVGNDPNELRFLRGEGRYFGLDDSEGIKEPEPKCRNCSQRGHFKRDCPHVICTFCGSMDDHYSQHCPKAIKCANCNKVGHYRSQCPNKWKRVFCTLCNSKLHDRDRCPSLWRSYLLREELTGKGNTKKLDLDTDAIYCYNCGGNGHFGDDCNQRRSSRVPKDDGSAFAGNNLRDELRTKYYKKLDQERGKKGRKNNSKVKGNHKRFDDNNNFNYDDYEYDDSIYDQWDNSQLDRKYSGSTKKKNTNKKQKKNNNSHRDPLEFPRSKRNDFNDNSKRGNFSRNDDKAKAKNMRWNNSKKNRKSYRSTGRN
ncbi:Zinc finger CCHC-type profile [Nakaseomyces glabratus]|nr:Zinc finger CCHC-type profile [Nakaseomyces glabratus]KAH7585459.1 Zinc finger CCHC-type profile [Nakaseomyces glabratus]